MPRYCLAFVAVVCSFLFTFHGAASAGENLPGLFSSEIANSARPTATRAAVGPDDFAVSGHLNVNEFVVGPDVAYDPVRDQYVVVWAGKSATETGGESEILAQRIDGRTGARLETTDFRLSTLGPTDNLQFTVGNPRVTYNSARNEFLVVWSADDDLGNLVQGEFEIHGQRLGHTTTGRLRQIGADDFRISFAGTDGNTAVVAANPDVVYDSTHDEYLVVWRANDLGTGEIGIRGQRLAFDAGTLVSPTTNGAAVSTSHGPLTFATDPAVAYNPTDDLFLVVWRADPGGGGLIDNENEIFGQLLLGGTQSPFGVDDFRISSMGGTGDAADSAFFPDVAYGEAAGRWLVVWQADAAGGGFVDGEFEIFAQLLDGADGVEVGPNDFRVSEIGGIGDSTRKASSAAVDYVAGSGQFVVSFVGDDLGDTFEQIFLQRIDPETGAETGVDDETLSSNSNPADASCSVAAGSSGRLLTVWSDPNFAAGIDQIVGQLYEIPEMFADGFESGDTSRWTVTVE